jgi:hypothetical protein
MAHDNYGMDLSPKHEETVSFSESSKAHKQHLFVFLGVTRLRLLVTGIVLSLV